MDVFDITPLRAVRERKQLSLLQVARAVCVSESQISKIERNVVQASPELAKSISDFFKNEVTRLQILYPRDYPVAPRKAARKSLAGRRKPARATHSSKLQEAT